MFQSQAADRLVPELGCPWHVLVGSFSLPGVLWQSVSSAWKE
jgi:hypothetical protein